MTRGSAPVLFVGLLVALALPAAGSSDAFVPEALAPWIPWVLDGVDQRACSIDGDGSGAGADGGARVCAWPGRLLLDIAEDGGLFAQHWQVQADSWVPLPGDARNWPQDVRVGERAVAVVPRDGRPALWLTPGEYSLSGRFQWRHRPDGIGIPPGTGLLSLRVDAADVDAPRVDADGRLWVGQAAAPANAGPDGLTLEVARRIDDDLPLLVSTRLALDVSGGPREIRLGPVPLDRGIPLRLDSPLPARLDEAGMLQIQLRPGRWVITLDAHHPGPVTALALASRAAPWPRQEVWAFRAHPDLRQVEVSGADPVDPRQTRLPADWQRLPSYLLRPGMTLELKPLRRGALGADRLRLDRDLWLDFGGTGLSLRDRITGQLERRWRLDVTPALKLGQVRVDGEPRVITRLARSSSATGLSGAGEDGAGREGVEVRQGRLNLVADARLGPDPGADVDPGAAGSRRVLAMDLPASGWGMPLEGIATRLHLPPGWDLLAVEGVDNLPDSWVGRWSLLDIFLVLIMALAVARLWGWAWGLLALATLVLIWQEPGAPRLVWLHVLGSAALLRVLPVDPERGALARIRALVRLYYQVSLLALALIALPFLVTQMRDGLFPQLDRPDSVGLAPSPPTTLAPAPMDQALGELSTRGREALSAKRWASPAGPASVHEPELAPLPGMDPDAHIQTGVGVPDWSWRSFALGWTGPVALDHRVRLWLLPPAAALGIASLQVVLVSLLGWRLVEWPRPVAWAGPGALALAMGAGLLGSVPNGYAQSPTAGPFPPPDLLETLKQRLLEPPECLPDCASIAWLSLDASPGALRLDLSVDAAEALALPVPGSSEGWRPGTVELDGAILDGMLRGDDGRLSVPVPAGRHRVSLSGPLPVADQVEIPLPLRPRLITTRIDPPWRIEGIDADGRPAEQLRLVREGPDAAAEVAPSALAPLVRVTRTLRLGLDWTVETRVERLSAPQYPVTLWVALLASEAVTSPDRQVSDGRILVSLPPGRRADRWRSTLPPVERMRLSATTDARLTETWRVEVSPIWHLEAGGVPAVQSLGASDRWLPTWRPWPGEHLDLTVSRPQAVPGPTLTLDRSVYRVAPARRATDATLSLTLRSSQGGRHPIRLPERAELTRFVVDGRPRTLAMQGRDLDLPLVPGSQQIELGWREPGALATRYRPATVDLGTPGVNADTALTLGRERWVLWTAGPGMGPAVLFWGLLAVLVPVAAVLGRLRLTPLGFTDWLLLGIGLSQAGVWVAALVALWLFALGLRRRAGRAVAAWRFNARQVGLALLSVAALLALLFAVQQGLLGRPEMQIAGNGSSPTDLRWYLDRGGPHTASVTVISVPIWVYRGLMLAWALWLALRLLAWLRWGWQGFSEPGLWMEGQKMAPRRRDASAAPGRGDEGLRLDL